MEQEMDVMDEAEADSYDVKALPKKRMGTNRDDSFRTVSTLNRSNTSINSYRNPAVSFEVLKERAYVQGYLYEDPDFPAHYSSIFQRGCPIKEPIVWKRPHELSKKPTFTANGYSKLDVLPGWLGETSLCSAFSCLTLAPNLVARCIPEGQEFDNKYSGIFHFKFWRFGEWIEVIIDDRLPIYNGQLMFSRGRDSNEFWIPLFEKAYAKFYVCYDHIKGGQLQWSLQDFTGGIMQTFRIQEDERRTQGIIDKCMAKASLIGVSINISNGPKNVNKGPQLPNGLLTGIAYTVTGYAEIPVGDHSAVIIRLHNPVNKLEWNGIWSKSSTLWTNVTDDMKEKLGHNNLAEGEFWMSYKEFSKIFTHLEVCHLSPECWQLEPKIQHRKKWVAVGAHRQWHRGYNSGGALDTGLLAVNNQFYMELQQYSCVLISVMQRYSMLRERTPITCSICIYKAPADTQPKLPQTHFTQSSFVATVDMKAVRENVGFFILPPGSYVVIPITANHGVEGRFFLRIYSDQINNVRELDDVDSAEMIISIRQLDTETIHVLRHRFLLMCNRYEEIDAHGLQQILSYREPTTFSAICCSPEPERSNIQRLFLSLETCKAAITIVDKDMNGRMNYDEFMGLVQRLTLWQHIFQKFTIGNGSIMDTYSLRSALKMSGFTVSNKTLEALVLRYAAKDVIPLEGFVNSVIKLHAAHQRYSAACSKCEVGEKERIQFLQELLLTAIYS